MKMCLETILGNVSWNEPENGFSKNVFLKEF